MIEIIAIGAVCLAAGAIGGYLSRKPKKPFNRCEFLAEMSSGKDKNRLTHTVRCELEMFHAGPHLHTVESGFSNEGQQVWFENKDSLTSILRG